MYATAFGVNLELSQSDAAVQHSAVRAILTMARVLAERSTAPGKRFL